MLEGYGISWTQSKVVDKALKEKEDEIGSIWTLFPPPMVLANPCFCNCERCYKWSPKATIDSIEYNWPRIPGPFKTSRECTAAYSRFFEQHKRHKDPGCFRAAVFVVVLANILVKL
jgi:hypothetical protein